MPSRKYSIGFAGQNFDFELPSIGEGETEQTKSVLASYFPELRLRYGAKTQRGGRLGRDVTPVQTDVTMAPVRESGSAVVNITGPTATQTITQAQPTAAPAASAPAAYTGPDYTNYFQDILNALNPAKQAEVKPEASDTTTPTETTPTTPATPALKQFTGNVGGINYQNLRGERFTAEDVQAAIKGGYDPASIFGYAASLPKSELGTRVRQDIREAGFKLSEKGAYGGTLPSAPTAAQTFLDKSIAKELSKGAEKQVSAAATRAQGISVAAASPTAQPTTIASPFTYSAPAAPAAAFASSSGGGGGGGKGGGGGGGGGGGKGGGGGGKGK